MFTGIVEATAVIQRISPFEIDEKSRQGIKASLEESTAYVLDLKLENPGLYAQCKIGDSIAVNGCCLTITACTAPNLQFVISYETWALTAFSHLKVGDLVNLERAMLLEQRLDGHLVSGHIDAACRVSEIKEMGASKDIFVCIGAAYRPLCIKKGSITIDGVSLTINDINELPSGEQELRFTLIPHTISVTRFRSVRVGTLVNVEFDMLGKYVQRLMEKN